MKKLLMLGAAFLALQAVPALAQDGPKEGHKEGKHLNKMFEMQDTDKDGAISSAEAAASAQKRFDETDANKDGKVTKEEAQKHMDAKRAEWKAKREAMKKEKADAPKEAPAAE